MNLAYRCIHFTILPRRYKNQSRKAIPVHHNGTLYIDPKPEIIYYLQDVFHHELFHILDLRLGQNGSGGVDWLRHGTFKDSIWENLNNKNFSYGNGGAFNRHESMFISIQTTDDDSVVGGFLNKYSTTAVEEDKAEVYAALIRYPDSLFFSEDPIIQSKAKELQRRLQNFYPEMDDAFWAELSHHSAAGPYPMATASHGTWVAKKDTSGNVYWFNSTTAQTSWLNPTLFDKKRIKSASSKCRSEVVVDPTSSLSAGNGDPSQNFANNEPATQGKGEVVSSSSLSQSDDNLSSHDITDQFSTAEHSSTMTTTPISLSLTNLHQPDTI